MLAGREHSVDFVKSGIFFLWKHEVSLEMVDVQVEVDWNKGVVARVIVTDAGLIGEKML